MGTQTRTVNAGPVGLKPKGAYNSGAIYTLLDTVLYKHDSWACKAMNPDGSAATISGIAPDDATYGAIYWQALTDGGAAAYAEGETARQKGQYAQTKGDYAQTKGDYADEEADRAKDFNDHPPYIADGTQEKSGDENYWYIWDVQNGVYVKSAYGKGDDLHWEEMSTAEKEALAQRVLEQLTFATEETCESIIDELT